LELILCDAEDQGWRVERGKSYYKMKCGCDTMHMKMVHISPSGAKYVQNLLGKLRRDTCWEVP
jgi:hypothetical protein